MYLTRIPLSSFASPAHINCMGNYMNACKSRVCVCSHCIKYATEQSVSQVCAHTMPPDSAHIPESMYRLYVFIRSTELPQRSESAPMLCVYFKRKKSPLVCVKFMRSKSSVSGQRAHTLMSKCTNTPTRPCSAALWRQSLRWVPRPTLPTGR